MRLNAENGRAPKNKGTGNERTETRKWLSEEESSIKSIIKNEAVTNDA